MIILRLFFLLSLLCGALESKPLKVNIISATCGKGLDADKEILSAALKSLGCSVCSLEGHEPCPPQADINIFCQHVSGHMLKCAKLNWLIPNPEWFYAEPRIYKQIDLFLCRTKEVERIFKNLRLKTYFLGFAARDVKVAGITKDFDHWLHVAGGSEQKGTWPIFMAWMPNDFFPYLTIMKWIDSPLHKKIKNLSWISERLPVEDLRYLQNHCGVHLCLSETEGFGHYLMEAMASGAVVITTNAPPMNEFIKDKRCLVPYHHTGQQCLATNYYVAAEDVEMAVKRIMHLPRSELKAIGVKNRAHYLSWKKDFHQKLKQLIESIERL